MKKNSKSILFVATGGKKWIGGLYYVKNMLYTITQSKNFEKYCIYILVNKESEDLFLPFENYNNVHIIFSTKGSENNIVSNLFRLLKRTIDLELLKVCHQYKIDYIFPVNKYPYMGLKDRCVFWIPDFQHIHLPHNFSKLQRYYRNLLFRYISRQKNKLILSSNDAFTDFIKFYNNSGEHSSAHVVPFTSFIDEEKNKIDEKYLMNIRKKYNLPKNFLFIGNQFWKHKNYNVALKAMNYIVNEMGGNIQLICTGNPKSYSNSDYYNELNRYIKQNNLEKNITILGFLPRLEQLAIMKLSDVIVQPSLFEGWGTVVEDAKSLSKYTIISNIKVHIEQKDNKSLIFEKNDYIDLANKIMGFMNSDKEEVTEQIANNQVKLYSDYFDKVFLAE
ncbi:glycosyltransferase [Bacillus sp. V3]|nr:glycosyltransferase [Bacillus sp. V3]